MNKSKKEKAKGKGKNMVSKFSISAGFTLIELMVTVGIFVFMTALLVARYGSFNNGEILTSMAYDVALALRNAQAYGLNVQGYNNSNSFNYPYGIDFDTTSSN
ncbi:MAG: type II secretion system protein, partial [Patescibacteria group bacterium]|nr:type II secretion system protein [Patescibacteria group bacterium]